MHCPKCKTETLQPEKLDHELPALVCSTCEGCQVELLTYRMWRESPANKAGEKVSSAKEVSDTDNAMSCGKCNSMMTKYRIDAGVDNKIDLCASCGEIWLDNGEWELLLELDLGSVVPKILSAPWQKSIKKKEISQKISQDYIGQLGENDYKKLLEVRSWINSHAESALLKSLVLRQDDL